jgi:hypothetical protein
VVAAATVDPRRRVGEALERERRALEVLAPPVVGKAAAGEPPAPEVERCLQALLGVGAVVGAVEAVSPAHGNEPLLAGGKRMPGARPVALDADPQVGDQPQDGLAVGRLGGRPVVADHLPARRCAPVVEHRLAYRLDLDLALDALDQAHEHVIGVVVGGRAGVRGLVRVLVVPRADREAVAHDDPAGRAHPGGLDDHRAGHVTHR